MPLWRTPRAGSAMAGGEASLPDEMLRKKAKSSGTVLREGTSTKASDHLEPALPGPRYTCF